MACFRIGKHQTGTKREQANAFIGQWLLAKNKLICQRRLMR
jgi:hypothetical protein